MKAVRMCSITVGHVQSWCGKVTGSCTLEHADGQFALSLVYRRTVPDLTAPFVAL